MSEFQLGETYYGLRVTANSIFELPGCEQLVAHILKIRVCLQIRVCSFRAHFCVFLAFVVVSRSFLL